MRFKCSENYTMVGSGKLTCLKSKKWNREIPECLGKPFVINTISTVQFVLTPLTPEISLRVDCPFLSLTIYNFVNI